VDFSSEDGNSMFIGKYGTCVSLLNVTTQNNFVDIFQLSPSLYILNSFKQLIFVMVKCGVLFEVRTEFLNNIYC
jgi:hypothetical protein